MYIGFIQHITSFTNILTLADSQPTERDSQRCVLFHCELNQQAYHPQTICLNNGSIHEAWLRLSVQPDVCFFGRQVYLMHNLDMLRVQVPMSTSIYLLFYACGGSSIHSEHRLIFEFFAKSNIIFSATHKIVIKNEVLRRHWDGKMVINSQVIHFLIVLYHTS